MLYPTTMITIAAAEGMSAIDAGSLVGITLTVRPRFGIMMAMAQLSPTQDFSIRAWVSDKAGGNFLPTNASYWELNRSPDQLVLVYDRAGVPPVSGNIRLIPVAPGFYVANVLNLINLENVFSFSSNEVVC